MRRRVGAAIIGRQEIFVHFYSEACNSEATNLKENLQLSRRSRFLSWSIVRQQRQMTNLVVIFYTELLSNIWDEFNEEKDDEKSMKKSINKTKSRQ